jgi:hypothetical protein
VLGFLAISLIMLLSNYGGHFILLLANFWEMNKNLLTALLFHGMLGKQTFA